MRCAHEPRDDRGDSRVTLPLRVHNGKNDKPRTVGLDGVVTPYLNRWMDKRKALSLGRKRKAPLFCTLDGGPVSQPYVRAMLRRKAAKTGLEKRCHHCRTKTQIRA